jgi:hypothetical protein
MKWILTCFVLELLNIAFSQSKREQIELLNFRVDSLNQILKAERNTHLEKVTAYNSTISNLQSQLSSLNQKMEEMTKEQSKNNLNTVQLLQQIDSLNKHGGLNRNSILKDCSGAVGNIQLSI